MALHELLTNAVKYGALKQPNGHLTIRWRREILSESGKPWLHLDWKESGVEMPPLGAKPHGSGQGRELIERVLPYQFDAQTTFAMEADGVHCTISLPASEHTAADHPSPNPD
jgi:two-component sensor histidine kinase